MRTVSELIKRSGKVKVLKIEGMKYQEKSLREKHSSARLPPPPAQMATAGDMLYYIYSFGDNIRTSELGPEIDKRLIQMERLSSGK